MYCTFFFFATKNVADVLNELIFYYFVRIDGQPSFVRISGSVVGLHH